MIRRYMSEPRDVSCRAFAVLVILVFSLILTAGPAHALWPDGEKDSKLDRDSYEKLVAKNLELRNEIESLTKEQEQLRGIYRVLLERVKTFQSDNAAVVKEKEDAAASAAQAQLAIENMKKELAENNKKIAQLPVSNPAESPGAISQTAVTEKELIRTQDELTREREQSRRLDEILKSALVEKEAMIRELNQAHVMMRENEKLAASLTEQNAKTEEQSRMLADREERVRALETETGNADAKLKSAEEKLKAQQEDAAALSGIFNRDGIEKKYPGVFGDTDRQIYKTSSPVKDVEKAVSGLNAKQKSAEGEKAALEKKIQKARESLVALKGKIDAADKRRADLKESIAKVNAQMKIGTEEAEAEKDKARDAESALGSAVANQKDIEARVQDQMNKAAQIKESVKKAAAGYPKESPAGFKSKEVIMLEKELDTLNGSVQDLAANSIDAGKNIEELNRTIAASRSRSEDALSKSASGKKKIKEIEADIAKSEIKRESLTKDLQLLTKNIVALEGKERAIVSDISARDAETRDLKKIVERQILDIDAADDPATALSGTLAGEAETTIAALSTRVQRFKKESQELKKAVTEARKAQTDAERKAKSERALPEELKRKINKESLDMHFNLAVVYDRNKMYKDAEREYLKCLKIDFKDADTHYNLGILYDDKLNDNQKASFHYKKFLELRPMGEEATQARVWLTRLEFETRMGRATR